MSSESQLKKRLRAITQARVQFRESVADPLKRAMMVRSPLAVAAVIWDIPMECAASGFHVTTSQSELLWTVEIERAIDDETVIHMAGQAKSLVKALFQLVESTERQLEEMAGECRRDLARMEAARKVAA